MDSDNSKDHRALGSTHEDLRQTLVWRRLFLVTAVVLGFIQTWAHRHEMNGDGISYLDMGDAYLRADWEMAISSVFSPLYSWFTGLALRIFRPSSYWEYTVVHLANFAIYLATLGCFTFFLQQLTHYRRERNAEWLRDGYQGLSEKAWLVLGYVLFIYSSLMWITMEAVEPDMCVAAFVYLAAGILLRIRRGETSKLTFAALGVVLGFGYLAKAVMFPLGIIFLLTALLLPGNIRKTAPRVALAAIVFLLVSSPFVIAISRAKGRFTWGDVGKMNYAYHVNNLPHFNWQGDSDSGIPKHSTRKIFDSPPVYEFATPIKGTYPNWYDPSYWLDGVKPKFNFREQIKALISNALVLKVQILSGFMAGILIILLLLFWVGQRGWLMGKHMLECWFLLLPSIAVLGMYLLIHLEQRYLAPFLLLICLALFAGVRLPSSQLSKRLISAVTVSILVIFSFAITPSIAESLGDLVRHGDAERNSYWEVANSLRQIGLKPGDKVGSLGGSVTNSKWARLARVQIIAEIYSFNFPGEPPNDDEARFWASDASVRKQVMQAFAKTGAKAVVTLGPPAWARADGWQEIGGTDFYVHFLQ